MKFNGINRLEILDTPESDKIHALIGQLRAEKGGAYQSVIVLLAG
jgi:hypothetical protein